MRRSSEKILTTHVGALPGEQAVWTGEASDDQVREAVVEVVGHQLRAGVDIVNEGELTKGGNWVTFVNDRMTGFEPRVLGSMTKLLTGSEDWLEFDQFYAAAMQHGVLFEDTGSAPDQARVHDWVCTGPIEYRGQAALEREIGLLKAALGERPASDAFLTSTAPASIEAANVRHEHEAEVWERVKLPEGKILAPGVVSHSTKLIEHPELVSHRIQRFAKMVGRENVIASTDCGLGLRCHPQIAWAKLKTLADGAALATKALW